MTNGEYTMKTKKTQTNTIHSHTIQSHTTIPCLESLSTTDLRTQPVTPWPLSIPAKRVKKRLLLEEG